jgi:ABC-type multidrug transport system ATPase subunit
MSSIEVDLPDGRHRTLAAEHPWTLVQAGETLTIVEDDPEAATPGTLGSFVHFGEWLLHTTQHPGLSRLRLNGRPVERSATVRLPGDVALTLAELVAGTPPAPPPADDRRTIGRTGGGADLEIDDPALLAHHAEVRRGADGEWVILARRGTVFVNGVECSSAPFAPDDTVIVGQSLVRRADLEAAWGVRREVTAESSAGGLSVRAVRLDVHNGRRPTLSGVDFEIAAGSLAVVIGPSGAGKSTLMGAILGGRRITGGELRVGDVHLRPGKGKRLLRHLVRFVPQRDDLFGELTVAETLDGAARLRMAPDVPAAERAARVTEVLAALRLEHRRHARVDGLSGGERRRTSIGVELVGKPHLLLLDEPTSGLDLALDRDLMGTLRQISRDGCTVIVITHSVVGIDTADLVLVLDGAGRLAQQGKPHDLVRAAAETGWPDLLAAAGGRGGEDAPRRRWIRLPQGLLGRHCVVLLRRGPLYAAGILALPTGGAVVAAAAAPTGLDAGPGLTQTLAILVTVAALSGTSLTYLDIVTGQGMLKRDWRGGAGPGRIVMAIFSAYALVCAGLAILAALMFLRSRAGLRPAFGVDPTTCLVLVLFLVLLASMAIGILISSVVRTVPQAVTASTVLAIAQVVLNGSLFHLPGWLTAPASLLPARLGLAALAGYADLNPQRQGLYTDVWWQHLAWRYGALLAGLVVMVGLALILATALLHLRWRRTIE